VECSQGSSERTLQVHLPRLEDREFAKSVAEVLWIPRPADRLSLGSHCPEVGFPFEDRGCLVEGHVLCVHSHGDDQAHVTKQRVEQLDDFGRRGPPPVLCLDGQLLGVVSPSLAERVGEEHFPCQGTFCRP
jgi:hypothetical protein